MSEKLFLIEPPTDSPVAAKLIVARKDGTVYVGTAEDIATDMFNAAHYDDPNHEVTDIWQWTPQGPLKLVTRQTDVPYGETGTDRWTTLRLLAPDGSTVAESSWLVE